MIVWILFCVALNSIGQILLKIGVSNLPEKTGLSIESIPSLISNVYLDLGALLYGASFFIWLYVLSKVKLSYAYPFISLSYLFVALLGYFFLGEQISSYAWMGIILIVIGVCLVGLNIAS